MNKKFLGHPNQSIINWLRRTPPTPVIHKLKMTATNGTVCEFDYKDVPQPLAYVNSSKVVQYPFTLCSDISDFNTVSEVNDEGNQISALLKSAFFYCSKLSSVNLVNVETINDNAFTYCAISSLTFPKVKNIEFRAFYNCNSLTSIECPNTEQIKDQTFKNCLKLSSVVLSNMTEDKITTLGGTNVFGDTRAWPVSVYVPENCIDDLINAPTWPGLIANKTIELVGV